MVRVTARDGRPSTRILCNRDESRRRARCQAVRVVHCGPVRVAMPIDGEAGGTWIGVSDSGLVAVLLNRSALGMTTTPGRRSRGEIVPSVLRGRSFEEASDIASSLPAPLYPPFRLLLVSSDRAAVFGADGVTMKPDEPAPAGDTLILSSSGLGDQLVEGPRAGFFRQLLSECADPLEAQRALHESVWPGREHLSVLMSRPDARTRSRTEAGLDPGRGWIRHTPIGDDLCPTGEVSSAALSWSGAEAPV
ncbi:MAG: NRDE family protein [Phycisphaerales bacterium]|nr:NRDE family protein [Phycisphaerales bacterium]